MNFLSGNFSGKFSYFLQLFFLQGLKPLSAEFSQEEFV